MLEDGVAVAGVIAIAALGDRVADEDQLAILPRHGARGKEGLGVALADRQFGCLVEMKIIRRDLGLEIEVAEVVDVSSAGSDGGLTGTHRITFRTGVGDAADHSEQVGGIGKIHTQIVHEGFEIGAGVRRFWHCCRSRPADRAGRRFQRYRHLPVRVLVAVVTVSTTCVYMW